MAKRTGPSDLRRIKSGKKRGSVLKAARMAGRAKKAKLYDDDSFGGLEETPSQPVLKSSNPSEQRKPKSASFFRKNILLPVLRLIVKIKKDRKLRLRVLTGAALFAAGVFVLAAVLSAGQGKPAGAQQTPGITKVAEAAQTAAEQSMLEASQHPAAEKQDLLPTTGSEAQKTQMPAMTPVPTTAPEPSVTPAPTQKPKSTSKPAPKPTQKPDSKATPKPTKKPASKSADLNKLAEFFMVEADKYYDKMGFSSNSYDYTEEEVLMLARVITREAGGESYEGMLAVGNVVMNRVFCGHWGNTIELVVTAKGQFAYRPDSTPKQQCIKAARDVLKNERWVVPQNVYFFNSGRKAGEDWGRYKYCMKIGGHCFYTHKIGKRYNGEGIPPALYERVYKWPQYGCKREKRVTRLQEMLKKLGYETGTDGFFGKTTKESVIKFQKDKGLKADGKAGPSTIKALIKAYGVDAYVKKYVK